MKTKQDIEFCYHIKNRWPHRITKKKNITKFENFVFDAIDREIELLEDEDMDWDIFTHKNSSLSKFNRKEQVMVLSRLKKALVENNNSFDEEDLILEEALNRVVVGYFEYISDCKEDYKKEWNTIKQIAEDDEPEYFFKEKIWHDYDFEMWELKPSHIKNYKKILQSYKLKTK